MNQCMWPYGATYDADWVEGAVCHALAPLLVQVVLPWVAFIAFQKGGPLELSKRGCLCCLKAL